MWKIADAGQTAALRTLENDDLAIVLQETDIADLAATTNRSNFQRALEALLKVNQKDSIPPFSNEELNSLRAAVGGSPFQAPPTFKRAT